MNEIITQLIGTIQGEGATVGVPSLLIRFAHCNLCCPFCFVDGTLVRTPDGYKNISDIEIDDTVLGINLDGKMKMVEPTKVYNTMSKIDKVYKLILSDGTELIGTSNHPILINNGYRPMFRDLGKLQPGDVVYKLETYDEFDIDDDYKYGWLAGYWEGDGSFYTQKQTNNKPHNKCRAASIDKEIINRNYQFCHDLGIDVRIVKHSSVKEFTHGGHTCDAITSTQNHVTLELKDIVESDLWSDSWHRGFIAGMFDAEGSFDGSTIKIAQITDQNVRNRIQKSLDALHFDYLITPKGFNIHNGKKSAILFDKTLQCVAKRKFEKLYPIGLNMCDRIEVDSIEYYGEEKVFDISTNLSTFIANDILVHNCDTKWSTHVDINDVRPFDGKVTTPFNLDGKYDDFVNMVGTEMLEGSGVKNIMITGGEPFMYVDTINKLLHSFSSTTIKTVEIETNGVLINCDRISTLLKDLNGRFKVLLNISPKLTPDCYNGNKTEEDIFHMHLETKRALNTFRTDNFDYLYKFVYSKEWEQEIMGFINRMHIATHRIYMMPFTPDRFSYPEDKEWWFIKDLRHSCQDTANFCLEHGFRYSPREHIFVYGDMKDEAEELRR